MYKFIFIFSFFCVNILLLSCKQHEEKTIDTGIKNELPTTTDSFPDTSTNISIVDTSQNVDPDRVIVPAERIGLSRLGKTYQQLSELLGPADSSDAAMGKSVAKWYSKTNRDHSTIIYFTTKMGNDTIGPTAAQIRITSPYFTTASGLKVGDKLATALGLFPGLKKAGYYNIRSAKAKVLVYDELQKGIAVEVDTNHNIIGISIHKPGEKAFMTYLSIIEGYVPNG